MKFPKYIEIIIRSVVRNYHLVRMFKKIRQVQQYWKTVMLFLMHCAVAYPSFLPTKVTIFIKVSKLFKNITQLHYLNILSDGTEKWKLISIKKRLIKTES